MNSEIGSMNPENSAISRVIEKADISLLREVKKRLEIAEEVRVFLDDYKKQTTTEGRRGIEVKYIYPKKGSVTREFMEEYCKVKSSLSKNHEKYTPEDLQESDWSTVKSAITERIKAFEKEEKISGRFIEPETGRPWALLEGKNEWEEMDIQEQRLAEERKRIAEEEARLAEQKRVKDAEEFANRINQPNKDYIDAMNSDAMNSTIGAIKPAVAVEPTHVPKQGIFRRLWNTIFNIKPSESSVKPTASVKGSVSVVTTTVSKPEDKESETAAIEQRQMEADEELAARINQPNKDYIDAMNSILEKPTDDIYVSEPAEPSKTRKQNLFSRLWNRIPSKKSASSTPEATGDVHIPVHESPAIAVLDTVPTPAMVTAESLAPVIPLGFNGDFAKVNESLLTKQDGRAELVSTAEDLFAYAQTLKLPGGAKLESLKPQWINRKTVVLTGVVKGVNFSVTVQGDVSGKARIVDSSARAGRFNPFVGTIKSKIGQIDQALLADINSKIAKGWKAQNLRIEDQNFVIDLSK